jgi:2-oxoglutarate ferredoxin oxidoreductase subunit gamma
MILKILLSGDGGQGIQLISDLLAQAAFASGLYISQIPNYGLEQRGGVSLSFLIISDKEVSYPKFSKPDILLIMSQQALDRTGQFQNAECKLQSSNYENVFKENNILPQSANIFFLGILSKILEEKNILKKEDVYKLLEKKLSVKKGWEENKKAFELGTL